jgi:integrase
VRRSDPRATKSPRKPTVLAWDEMHAFAAAAGPYEPMIRMLGDCGLGIGELFALRREQQDLKTGIFVVDGSAWEGEVVGTSEEKRHDRAGPIPPGCLELLRAMPARIDAPWLFPTHRGKLWRINNFYRGVWNPARLASGIDCTPHDFRHYADGCVMRPIQRFGLVGTLPA